MASVIQTRVVMRDSVREGPRFCRFAWVPERARDRAAASPAISARRQARQLALRHAELVEFDDASGYALVKELVRL